MSRSLIHEDKGAGVRVGITPSRAGWRYLSFEVIHLNGETYSVELDGREAALVPLEGEAEVAFAGERAVLRREGVFNELPTLVYLPPGVRAEVRTQGVFTFALGSAPADGRYPPRLIHPEEMHVELRGGANALRQVTHLISPPLPAERLLIYEVYTPSGSWSGWPPHRHDRELNSPYLEETYYYRITPGDGRAIHRNYSGDDRLDELLLVRDGDLVLVPEGYHPVVALPGSNVYYLNYLAGELQDGARATPPVDDPAWAWMRRDWEGRRITLPIGSNDT